MTGTLSQDRREFLRSIGRHLLLAGLFLLGGSLIFRRTVAGGGGKVCPEWGGCGACPSLAGCEDPRALSTRKIVPDRMVWQLDPAKCVQCGRCATVCVLSPSAVKCVHNFRMCGYCKLCFGYFQPGSAALDEAAENQLCPTGALHRAFVEDPYHEYTIDESLCIGCGKCVKGCTTFGNGSLQLQARYDRCVNCNECSIARNCPAAAWRRVPAMNPYILKEKT